MTLWSYLEEESKVLRETRENPMLKGVPLPGELKLTTDMAAVRGCGLVVVATPSFPSQQPAHRAMMFFRAAQISVPILSSLVYTRKR